MGTALDVVAMSQNKEQSPTPKEITGPEVAGWFKKAKENNSKMVTLFELEKFRAMQEAKRNVK